jgi:hypothetical protein
MPSAKSHWPLPGLEPRQTIGNLDRGLTSLSGTHNDTDSEGRGLCCGWGTVPKAKLWASDNSTHTANPKRREEIRKELGIYL